MADLTPLKAGVSTVINQRVGGANTPVYPFTKTANVKDAEGKNLDQIIAGLAPKEHGNHVPDFASETVSNLKFLRNDNTWATIQNASTEQAGVVQLSDATNLEDSTVAATAKAVKVVSDEIAAIKKETSDDFVKKTQLGASSTSDTTGVATLDTNGHVPAAQLPSFVDDVIDCKIAEDLATATTPEGEPITPESGKIYVDVDKKLTYRWSGTTYVEISQSLALGETAQTAFAGDKGKVAYDHANSEHARVDATKTEASEKNGYVKVNGADVLVYTHPTGDSATNPHGTTAADVGLGNVENKTSEEIRAEITKKNVTDALGFTPSDASVLATASTDGLMSKTYAAKLDNCMQTAISAEEPAFTDGLWFQIVAE